MCSPSVTAYNNSILLELPTHNIMLTFDTSEVELDGRWMRGPD